MDIAWFDFLFNGNVKKTNVNQFFLHLVFQNPITLLYFGTLRSQGDIVDYISVGCYWISLKSLKGAHTTFERLLHPGFHINDIVQMSCLFADVFSQVLNSLGENHKFLFEAIGHRYLENS